MAEKVLAGLSERAMDYIERIMSERDEAKAQAERDAEAARLTVEHNTQLESRVQELEARLRAATNTPEGSLADALSREVGRSVDLKKAVEATMVNLGGRGVMASIPASTADSVRHLLDDALKAWKADRAVSSEIVCKGCGVKVGTGHWDNCPLHPAFSQPVFTLEEALAQ